MAEKRAAKNEPDQFAETWRLPLSRLLLAAAIGISSYLLYVSLSHGSVAGCGPSSSCDRVLTSRWAYWFGIPISAPALLVYITLFAATILLKRPGDPALKRRLWHGLFALAMAILGAGAWFIAMMVFVIQGICPWCLAAHTCGIIVAVLILRNAPIRPVPELPWQKEKHLYLPPPAAKRMAAVGVLALVVMVSGQLLHQKRSNLVVSIPSPVNAPTNRLLTTQLATNPTLSLNRTNLKSVAFSSSNATPVAISNRGTVATFSTDYKSNPAPAVIRTNPALPPVWLPTNAVVAATNRVTPLMFSNPVPAVALRALTSGRVVTTHNGLFQFDLNQVPLWGAPDAPDVIISLFDYTCHHCHTMHGHLQEALNFFSNRLAIVSLPMPLDAECNALIPRTHRTASNACNYARLGLAVWRADPARFRQFDDYMFSKPLPPPIVEASNFAANLVDADKLGQALMEPWIATRLQQDISIYHTNALLSANNGAMPQLVIGSKISIGQLNSGADLIRLIQESFAKP